MGVADSIHTIITESIYNRNCKETMYKSKSITPIEGDKGEEMEFTERCLQA